MSGNHKRHELRYRSAYKRAAAATMCAAILLSNAGCGDTGADSRISNGTSSVTDVLNQGMEAADANTAETDTNDVTVGADTASSTNPADSLRGLGVNANAPTPEEEYSPVLSTTEGVDIDLTTLSSTIVYSEVYNMMYYPETYVGKVIKIKGQYAISEMGEMRYDLCIIKDATACCAQGMEFLLTDAYVYPKDYPEVGDEIELVGTFDTYYEGEYLYCTLRNSTLLAMQ